MNWGRGLFRLWLVLSVLWIGTWGFAMRPDQALAEYRESTAAMDSPAERALGLLPPDRTEQITEEGLQYLALAAVQEKHRKKVERSANNLKAFISIGPAFSATVFIIGALLLWAFRGFRGKVT